MGQRSSKPKNGIGTRKNVFSVSSGGTCSYANFCPVGQACMNCGCEKACLADSECPQGMRCASVTNAWGGASICVPQYDDVPQAIGIAPSYIQFLANYPAQLVQYFVSNFSNVDLSLLGVPGPSSNGSPSMTRGPLKNINTTGEITGSAELPYTFGLLSVGYSIDSLQGIDTAQVVMAPGGQTVSVPKYGPLTNFTTSNWDYATGNLHVNTVIMVHIPVLQVNMNMASICSNATANLQNVTILIPVGLNFVPGLSLLYSAAIEPSLVSPTIDGVQFQIGNVNFSCNADPLTNSLVNVGIDTPGPVQNFIVNSIQSAAVGPITNVINKLFTTYNQVLAGFTTQFKIIDPVTGDVLINTPQQLAALYLQYLASQGTSPLVLFVLQQSLAKGIQQFTPIFNWQPVAYTCQTIVIPAPTGCMTYQTKWIQPLVGTSTASTKTINATMAKHLALANPQKRDYTTWKQLDKINRPKTFKRSKTQSSNSLKMPTKLSNALTGLAPVFQMRAQAMQYCTNNKQGFLCSPDGYGCLSTPTLATVTTIYDPAVDNVQDLNTCGKTCLGQACGTTNNSCNTIDQCNFNFDPGNRNTICDIQTLRGPNQDCNKKCPNFNLDPNGSGACTPAIGGQFYNDPTCGQGNPDTTPGSCTIVSGFSRSCYNSFPNPQDGEYGKPMTANACANLAAYTDIAPVFVPNGTCDSMTCPDNDTPGGPMCGPKNPTQACLRYPVVPKSQGGSGSNSDQFTGWSPSQCPATPCDPVLNPCKNGGVCVSTPSGNLCKPCSATQQCPAGFTCDTTTGQCNTQTNQCSANQPCPPSQVCDQSKLPYSCVDAATTTGSCVFNAFGVQSCFSQFPIQNDNNYNAGDPITNDMCTYLGQQAGNVNVVFRPNQPCREACPATLQCTSSATRCTPFPAGVASANTWSPASCP